MMRVDNTNNRCTNYHVYQVEGVVSVYARDTGIIESSFIGHPNAVEYHGETVELVFDSYTKIVPAANVFPFVL